MIDSIAVTPHLSIMATLTIRDLPDEVRDKLRIRAAEHGRSMEAEVREVLAGSVTASNEAISDWDAAVSAAQEAFAPFRNPAVSIVDELIAERRLESWRETVEAYEWINRNCPAKPVTLPLRKPRDTRS